jgi:hypothetical protein
MRWTVPSVYGTWAEAAGMAASDVQNRALAKRIAFLMVEKPRVLDGLWGGLNRTPMGRVRQ